MFEVFTCVKTKNQSWTVVKTVELILLKSYWNRGKRGLSIEVGQLPNTTKEGRGTFSEETGSGSVDGKNTKSKHREWGILAKLTPRSLTKVWLRRESLSHALCDLIFI